MADDPCLSLRADSIKLWNEKILQTRHHFLLSAGLTGLNPLVSTGRTRLNPLLHTREKKIFTLVCTWLALLYNLLNWAYRTKSSSTSSRADWILCSIGLTGLNLLFHRTYRTKSSSPKETGLYPLYQGNRTKSLFVWLFIRDNRTKSSYLPGLPHLLIARLSYRTKSFVLLNWQDKIIFFFLFHVKNCSPFHLVNTNREFFNKTV